MADSKKILKTASFMVVATLLAKVFGLLREMFLASTFGTNYIADSFVAASNVPLTLFDMIIGGVISSTFIPIFNEYLEKDKDKDEPEARAMRFANLYVNTILLITFVITVLGVVFSKQLISVLAPGLEGEANALAVSLSMILFPMLIFTGLAYSFVGILQSFGEYNIPSVISLVSNGAIIAYFIVFSDKFGVYGLAVAMLIGWGLQALVQVPWLKKFGFSYRPMLSFRDDGIRSAARLALPMLVSTWVQPLCTLINTVLASYASVSALNYANKLYLIVTGVFSFVVTNLIFPMMSRASVAGKKDEVKEMTVTSLKSIAAIILPIMVIFFLMSGNITSIIYERGEFNGESVMLTAGALKYYSLGMLTYAFCEIMNKSFFAMHNSKTPMITSVSSIVVNIVLCVLFFSGFDMGLKGLALAAALSSVVNAALLYFFLCRHYKNNGFGGKGVLSKSNISDIVKIIASAAVMAAVTYFVMRLLPDMNKYAAFLIPAVCGAVAYVISCVVLRVDELSILIGIFKKKGDNVER